jgi:hypothetical protein
VMAYLRKNRFPGIRTKLQKWKYGPLRVAKKINDNAYILQLPDDWNISNTFNVADLLEYHEDVPLYSYNSGRVCFQEEETDVGHEEEAAVCKRGDQTGGS